MKKLKEIEKEFPHSWRTDNGQQLYIRWCEVGDNFYDYGQAKPLKMKFDKKYEYLRNDPRIRFTTCEDCCGCAGW